MIHVSSKDRRMKGQGEPRTNMTAIKLETDL